MSRIDDLVAAHWPAMLHKLGDRRDAFFDAVREHAARHGFGSEDAATARYLNLCFVFSPGFERRPENEWALAILADDRLAPWLKAHQLVLRAARELTRRGGDADALRRADLAVLDALDRDRAEAGADAVPLARTACDIEAIELRLLDSDWRQQYSRTADGWQRLPLPALPPPLRAGLLAPPPAAVCMLSYAADEGPTARLQLRQIVHGQCSLGRHPGATWLDATGLSRWEGHEARAVSWPVRAMSQPEPANGLGMALVEETTPAVSLLDIPSCGLRDEGIAQGAMHLPVHVYPAQQWLVAVQRTVGEAQHWPRAATTAATPAANASAAAPAVTTRVRIECDGAPRDSAAWVRGFDEMLGQGLAQGLDRLFAVWKDNVRQPSMQATPGILTGQAALSWGWREGASGLAGTPVLRVLGDLRLACSLDLLLEGEAESGGVRARVQLHAQGEQTLQLSLTRELPQPTVLEALMPAVARFRFPFALSHDPLASDEGAIWHDAGPCTGAVVGEAGLRPRLSGGSGWQWYARMQIEPVLAPVTVHDPVLGRTRRTLALLPAVPLLDWSLG